MSINHHLNEISRIIQARQDASLVKRYALFPIQDEEAFKFYKKQEVSSWTADELNFCKDVADYEALPTSERHIIDSILAFFLTGDGIISENIILRFLLECETFEQQSMFISQLKIELTHAETYGLAAFTLVRNEDEMKKMMERSEQSPSIIAKSKFMEKWMHSDRPKAERLLAFAAAEGIFFPTSFAFIFWYRSQGKFSNFIQANELIAKDEGLHRDFGCYLYMKEGRCDPTIEIEIIRDAVACEELFIKELLPHTIKDINAEDMIKFCHSTADSLLSQINSPMLYHARNPFTWMNDISMQQKSNFYEVKNVTYTKSSLTDVLDVNKRCGKVADDVDRYQNPEDIDL